MATGRCFCAQSVAEHKCTLPEGDTLQIGYIAALTTGEMAADLSLCMLKGSTVTTALYCPNSWTETLLGFAPSWSCRLVSGASESLSNWSRLSFSLNACFLCSRKRISSLLVADKPFLSLSQPEGETVPQHVPVALLPSPSFLSACNATKH